MSPAAAIRELSSATNLEQLYPALNANRMTPGWHKKRRSLWPKPKTAFRPLHWSYDTGRVALDQAGRWMDMEMAERRNLLLFNPVGDNDYDTVRTLVVAYQMLMPGEHARAHWHTPNAMRFILDADEGCFSVVDGVKVPMRSGDVLLTPSCAWHSHFNEGQGNAYWIDVLDVPLVHLLEPMFWVEHPERYQTVTSAPQEHPFYRPLASTQALLSAAPVNAGVSQVTLDTAKEMKTYDIGFIKVASGSRTPDVRNTASHVFVAHRGRGTAQIGDQQFAFARGDVLAVPSWTPFSLQASEETVFLQVSDTPVMTALGFFRAG